jgi:prophage tail gpP-like protein
MATKTIEKATLIVGGGEFEDWEEVWAQITWGDAFSQFKFVCAEREGSNGTAQRFKPGDQGTVLLAGQLAVTGEILTRQVAYDANNHKVMLHGVSDTWAPATSSIVHETSSFDGRNFEQIADEVLKPTGVKYKTEGNLDKTKWKRMHCAPGEPIFNFLERIARDRKILVTCTKKGEFLFVGEGRKGKQQGELIEGRNILKMQCVISNSFQRSKLIARNQTPADNTQNMRPACEQKAEAPGRLKKYRPIIIPMEQPVWNEKECQQRVNTESMWTAAQEIKATVTVQGWQPGGPSGGGDLWEAGSDVMLTAPMALLHQTMSIESVTFTQDNRRGSLTTLLLVAPWGLNGTSKLQVGGSSPPAAATN